MKPAGLNFRVVLSIGALALTACAALLAQFGVMPSFDRIAVPHAIHTKAKVECISCHESVFDQSSLADADSLYPKEKACLQCHREDKEEGRCGKCHTSPAEPRTYYRHVSQLKMSHAKHIELVKEDCGVCHTNKALPNPVRPEHAIVSMESCLGCHNHREQYDKGECQTCHTDLAQLPLKPLSSFEHRSNYARVHGNDARASSASCAQCHEQTFCTDCHNASKAPLVELRQPDRVDRNFIHRNDFLSRHMIEARTDQAMCLRCHGTNFCQSCHERQNLTSGSGLPRNPHPAEWAFTGNAQGHGAAARADVTSCAACHDQGAKSVCVNCHRSGGAGGNPHPMGYGQRHSLSEAASNAMCRTCH